MAWAVLYPTGTDPNNPPTNYAKAENGPREGSGIHALRSAKKRIKDKQRYEANRRARSLFNAEFSGEVRGEKVRQFHAGLEALAKGTYN